MTELNESEMDSVNGGIGYCLPNPIQELDMLPLWKKTWWTKPSKKPKPINEPDMLPLWKKPNDDQNIIVSQQFPSLLKQINKPEPIIA